MTVVFESDTALTPTAKPQPLGEEKSPSFGKVLGAAFRRENTIGSALATGFDQVEADEYFGRDDARNKAPTELPADFNPFKQAVDHGYSESELDALIRSNPQSREDFEDFDFSLQRQRRDAETLAESGASGVVAQLAAGILDPTILIESQAAIKAAKGVNLGMKLVNMGKVAKGARIAAAGAAMAGVAGAEGIALQEAGLQASQTGRSAKESALNIAGGAVAGPVLVGGGTALVHLFGGRVGRYAAAMERRGQTIDSLGNRLADDLNDVSSLETMQKNMDDVMTGVAPTDLSAAATDFTGIVTTMEEESLVKAFGVEKVTKNFTPLLRLLQSPSKLMREHAQGLFENSMLMNKIRNGYAQDQAVERMVKMTLQDAEGHIAFIRKKYGEYLKDNGATGWKRVTGALGKEEGVLTFDQFKTEVTKAMREGDDHADMSIREAARNARGFYDKILERGKQAGAFPAWMTSTSTETAQSFVNRIYNTEKIIREEKNWRDTIRPHITAAVRAAVNDFHQVHKGKVDRFDGMIGRLEVDNAKLRDSINNSKTKGGNFNVLDIERMADVDVAEAQKRLAALSDEQYIESRTLHDVDPEAVANSRYAEVLRDYPDPEVAPEDVKAIIEQYNLQAILADVQFVNQKKPITPASLVDYLHKRGGLRDTGGDLASMGITNKTRVGFINNRASGHFYKGKRGMELDEALGAAIEEGYLRQGSDTDDLLQALDLHFNRDTPTYLDDDLSTIDLIERLEHTKQTLSEFGVSNPRQFYRDILDAAKAERKGARSNLKAAKERQKLSKEIADQVRGDLKEKVNPQLAELYSTRKYLKAKAEAQIKRNEKRIAELQSNKEWADVHFREKLRDKYKVVDGDMSEYVEEVVREVTNKITGRGAERLPDFITMAERGPLKGRTFRIDDKTIEGFLNNDIEHLISSYARNAGGQVEVKTRFGTLDVEEALKPIKDEYNGLAERIMADPKLTDAERQKQLKNLNTYLERDLRDFRSGWDLALGTFNKNMDDPDNYFVRGAQALRTLNYLRLLGGVVMSSLTDIAMPVFVHGMERYYGEFLPSLITNLKGVKLQVKDARFLRIAMEHEQASYLSAYAELGNPYAQRTMVERFLQNMGRQFGKVTGMVYWNNLGQKIASSMSQTRILSAIEDSVKGKIAKSEDEYLNFLGLDKTARKAIWKQYEGTRAIYGQYEGDGVRIAGVEKWTDGDAVSAYRAALGKDVDRTIIQRGQGDVPLFFNTEIGKTMTQFKSFAAASHSKLLIAGLQRRDKAAIAGFAHLAAMGMMVNYLKSIETGRELSDNPADWIVDGLDRSGIAPLLFEVGNTADKMNIGPRSLLGLSESSRYASRSAVDALLGPSAGFLGDMASTVGALAGDESLSSSDVHKMRRLLLGNNVTYIRPFFDRLEDAYESSQKGD